MQFNFTFRTTRDVDELLTCCGPERLIRAIRIGGQAQNIGRIERSRGPSRKPDYAALVRLYERKLIVQPAGGAIV